MKQEGRGPRRAPLLWLLLPFASGIALARHSATDSPVALATLAVMAAGAALFSANRYPILWHVSLCICALSTGMIRFTASGLAPPQSPQTTPREASLSLAIERIFNTSDPDQTLGIARIVNAPVQLDSLDHRRIYFALTSPLQEQEPIKGEVYRAIGVIRPLQPSDAHDTFSQFLSNQGAAHTYKQGYLLERLESANALQRAMVGSRDALADVLSRNKLPESIYTGAYKALMLGQKSELSSQQKDLFLANGTMHLFAISGLHIGVIAACIHHLLILLRFRGIYRSVATLCMVLLFVMVTGGSASSWRALLMIACLYLVQSSRRQASPLSALALSALIYLIILPGQLFQAGFQMSYLTVAAILLFGLPFADTLNKATDFNSGVPRNLQSKTQQVLSDCKIWLCNGIGISSAAFITSSLLGAYYFQILPSYGILVNLFALPVASLAIVAGFLSILLSPLNLLLPVSDIFNNAALVVIKLIHEFLERVGRLPGASIATEPLAAGSVFLSLLCISALIAIAYCRAGKARAAWWQSAPLAATAVSLFLLLRG